MNQPLISVIIPVYNVKEFLGPCIESALNQSYRNLEIITVDDGSSDGSAAICDRYAAEDDRVKVLHKENGGLSSARNAGIDSCKGDYICFVDGDDLIAPDFVEVLYSSLNGADMAFCPYDTFENQPSLTRTNLTNVDIAKFSSQELLSQILTFRYPLVVIACNKIYKREVYRDIRFPIKKVHEDEFVIHSVIDNCREIIFVDAPLYLYRQREGSVMTGASKKNAVLDKLEAFWRRRQFFLDRPGFEEEIVRLNSEILYRCLMSTVEPDNKIWREMTITTILFKNRLPLKAKLLLFMKKVWYKMYLHIIHILKKGSD